MTFETFTRICALILVAGWTAVTLPSVFTGRWRADGRTVRWAQLPEQRRAEIVRTAGGLSIFGLGALFAPERTLGGMLVVAILLPGVVTALCWGRIDLGKTQILRHERPAPYWTMVLIGTLLSAAVLATLIWLNPVVTTA